MKKLTLLLLLTLSALSISAQQLAFPGAYGFGRFATGGRNGSVYHVTNLNDSGAGSLRDAVSSANRIIVFDVAGVIKLNSRLVFKNNLYVAGQTAPGEGITVYGNGVSFSGASNIIVRHMRFRMGKGGDSGKDCAGIASGTNMIFDHCSFAWGLDETFSINSDGKGELGNITLQNSIIGQGLLTHSAGGLMQADNITLYRNFYCDNSTRNNKVKGIHQYVNNIVYNWSNGCYIMGGDSQGQSFANTTGNLFINGPSGGGNAMTGANSDFHIYVKDNWQDKNRNGVFDPYEIPNSELSGGPTVEANPFNYPTLEEVAAKTLIEGSLPTVGASLPYRDYVDYYMVDQCLSFGKQGMLYSNEDVLPYGNPSTWTVWKGNTRVDTDKDGMPDAWEKANGTDPNKDDAMAKAANGYCNIENYINSITQESVDHFLRKPMLLEASASTQNSITLSWADYTVGEEGFIVEIQNGSAWTELGKTSGTTFTVEGLDKPATAYTFRVFAYNGDQKSDYANLTAKTQPEQIDLVDVNNFVGETSDIASSDEKDLLIDTDTDLELNLNTKVSPKNTVVKGTGNVTISGAAGIGGTGSLNKAGSGDLTLNTLNSFTGPAVIYDGTVSLRYIANGGVPSSIGSSPEFAQYWVWNGGTWNYTGISASTNRSANLMKNTKLRIDRSDAVLKMTGVLQGNGGFILDGNGQLQPSSSSFFSYDGDTRLEGGTLYLNGVSGMWTDKLVKFGAKNKLVLAGGKLFTKDANDTYSTYMFDIETIENTISELSFHRNCSIRSKVYGNGDIIYHVNYLREYISGDWSGFTGRIYPTSTTGKNGEQQFMINNESSSIPYGVVELKGQNTQIICWKSNATVRLGGVAGDAGTFLSGFGKNDKSGGTWQVGGAGSDETFNGIIDNRQSANNYNGKTNIIKEGAGYWRLNGNNVYAGTTTVRQGELIVNGTHSGTGAYTVMEEGALSGRGSIAAAVTLNSGAAITPGDGGKPGTQNLTIGGKFTAANGSFINIPVSYTKELRADDTDVTATWANNQPAESRTTTASYTDNLAFSASNIIMDEGVKMVDSCGYYKVGDGAYPETKVTWYKTGAATSDPTNWNIVFTLTAKEDFTPTGLSAFMLRAGSDAAKVGVSVQVDNGAIKSLATGLAPKRYDKDNAYESEKKVTPTAEWSQKLTGITVPKGSTLKIIFNCDIAKTKAVGLGNVVVSGIYKKQFDASSEDSYRYTAACNKLILKGAAAINGATINLDIDTDVDIQAGSEFQIFQNAQTITGSAPTIVPATPGAGLEWDTTDLFTKGVLKVKADASAIESTTTSHPRSPKASQPYNLNGQKVTGNERGIVVRQGKKWLNR